MNQVSLSGMQQLLAGINSLVAVVNAAWWHVMLLSMQFVVWIIIKGFCRSYELFSNNLNRYIRSIGL